MLLKHAHCNQTEPKIRRLQVVRDTYESLLKLENEIETYFRNPIKNVSSDLTLSLEHYNRMLNLVIIKIKILDRMYIRSVLRLLSQGGPIFLKYNYSMNHLMDMYGWTKQEVVNLLTWLTDVNYLWFLFKRSVKRYKYLS